MYGEHWLGNDFVHRYTKSQPLSEMFIAATGFQEGKIGEVKMNNFTQRDKYKRLYSDCSVVTAELVVDSLQMCEDWERQRNSNFMTIDSGEKDNYCSLTNKGFNVWFNGVYTRGTSYWLNFVGLSLRLKTTQMMVRRTTVID